MSSAEYKVEADEDENDEVAEYYREVRYVGPLTEEQRLQKVHNYWRKKQNKSKSHKYQYVCRQ